MFAVLVPLLFIGGCDERTPEEQSRKDDVRGASAADRESWEKQVGRLTPADRILVCRAAIAAVMGRPIEIIHAEKADTKTIHTNYRRPDDGTRWRNACRVVRDQVLWAAIQEDGSLGRWRDDPLDAVVTFTLDETTVTVVEHYDDGSASRESFSRTPSAVHSGHSAQ